MRKYLLTLLFLVLCSTSYAATTWYACSGGGNWNGAGVWTSLLADEVGCTGSTGNPVAGDTAILNSNSGNITINAASAAATMDETGYARTLAFGTQTLTLTAGAKIGGAMTSTSGTITDGGGTITLLSTATGSFPTLNITSATTLTASSYIWPGALTLAGASAMTVTLSNSGATWRNSGLVTFSTNTVTLNQTISGDTLQCDNGLTVITGVYSSTAATIILTGGTWSGNSNGNVGTSLTLNGNVTVSGSVGFGNSSTATLTYLSGTITVTGSTLNLAGNENLNTGGMTWNNITCSSGGTVTQVLTSSLNAITYNDTNGILVFSGAYPINVSNWNESSNGTFVSGQILNVTNSISIGGNATGNVTLNSTVGSSPTYINYTGTKANQLIARTIFTDIWATGGIIYNFGSGTLTRTSGIRNVSLRNIQSNINSYNGL